MRKLSILAACIALAAPAAAQQNDAELIESARRIHERIITIDSHDDISGNFGTPEMNPCAPLSRQVDLPKMKEGGLDVAFFIVYVGQGERTPAGYASALEQAEQKFTGIRNLPQLCPEQVEIAYRADDVERISASGKRVVVIGIENGYPIGTDLEVLRRFYRLGGRYLTLTHNGHNDIGDSSNPLPGEGPAEHGGLSEFGRQVVEELNRLGMMVDVSHVAKSTMLQATHLSKAPVIASHSGAKAVNDNARNLDDEQLLAIKANGGVVQAVALAEFVKQPSAERVAALQQARAALGLAPGARMSAEQREQFARQRAEIDARWPVAGLDEYIDHIDHMVRLIGIDHVGISSDFDGGGGVLGWMNAAETFNVTLALVRRGYGEEEIRKLWGGNLLRVWREVERVAARLQRGAA